MEVWIVLGVRFYEGSEILAVCASEEGAGVWLSAYRAAPEHEYPLHDDYCVVRYPVLQSERK